MSRSVCQANSEQLFLLPKQVNKQRIIKYYLSSNNLIAYLEQLQKQKNFLLNQLIANNESELKKIELAWIEQELPQTIAKIENAKQQAQSLLDIFDAVLSQ